MDSSDRSDRLLALILLSLMEGGQRERAVQLSLAGFTNVEIANLLQTTTQTITQVLYEARKGRSTKKQTAKGVRQGTRLKMKTSE